MGQSQKDNQGKAVSISMASQITGIEVHTLRYWEKEFEGWLNPLRTAGGQRRYRAQDIQTVLELKSLLRDQMFSIAGAKKVLTERLNQRRAA